MSQEGRFGDNGFMDHTEPALPQPETPQTETPQPETAQPETAQPETAQHRQGNEQRSAGEILGRMGEELPH